MIEKDIGKRIQEYRKKRGLSQEQLAEKISVSTRHLSALERGIYNIKLETLVNILNELDCSADEVFCNEQAEILLKELEEKKEKSADKK